METGSIDPKFEFDAPFFVNFEEVQEGADEEDNVDGWFAVNSHLERDDLLFPAASADKGTQQGFSGNFISSDPAATVAVKREEQEGKGEVSAVPQTETAGPPAVNGEGESGEEGAQKEPPTRLGQKRSAAAIPSQQTPAMKQQRVQRGSSKKAVAAIKKILKPTVAVKTPEHMRRYLTKKEGQVKRPREELEAEEVEKMQAESRKKLREHRKTFHRLADSGKKPAKSVKHSKPTTESVGFKFRTETRVRRRRSAAVATGGSSRPPLPQYGVSHASQFPMTLRSASNTTIISESEGPRKTTEAKPFNFCLATRFPKEAEGDEKKDGYVSTAEYVFRFQAGTPERFRALPRKPLRTVYATVEDSTLQTSTSTNSSGAGSSGLTMPFTPKLLAKNRARPTYVKSSAEIEEEELAKIRQNPIKAQLLNPKVFTGNGQMGVPKKPQHSATQAHTPKLATKERGEARAQETSDDSETQPPTFRAQPLPKGLFDKVLGLPKKQEPAVTCPKSPAFSLQRRNFHPNTDEEKEEGKCHVIVAHPVPDFSHKFEPQLNHKKTEPVPFSFEERDKAKPTRSSFVQMILEKEKKEPFKANPVPSFDKPCLPEVGRIPITEPRTPSLQTKIRGQEHENKWRQTLSEMVQKEKENAEFRAKDPKVLYKSPFRAKTGNRQITEVSNIILHTEVRSEQRAEFERECKNKEEERQQGNLERQKAVEAEETKRVALLRHSLVHKAQPIRHYARTVVKPSSKPLTAPQPPNFQLRQRGVH